MGLFINNEQHHSMYKNSGEIIEPNQATFRRDHLSDLLKEQQKMNESFHKSIRKLGLLHEQRGQKQSKQWQEVNNSLGRLEKINHQQELQMLEQLKILTDENKKLQMIIENNEVSGQEMMNQMKQHQLNNENISRQLAEHKEGQQEVLGRLDNQEALIEKALRQLSHLRSILFERTSDLAETIEEKYQLTSSYVYQLLTGADQSLTFYMPGKGEKEKGNQEK